MAHRSRALSRRGARHRPLRRSPPRRRSRPRIGRLPGRKVVFTNGSREHARRVTRRLRARRAASTRSTASRTRATCRSPRRRPSPPSSRSTASTPARAAMFEDDQRNLAVPHGLGMRTVLVGPAASIRTCITRPRTWRASSRCSPDLGSGMERIDGRRAGGGRRRRGADRRGRLRHARASRVICVDPVPPVTSAEAEGSDLRSTAFLQPAVELLAAGRALGPAGAAGGAAPGDADRRRRRRRGGDPRDGGLRGARDRGGGLRLEPAQLAAAPRDGGAARRAAAARAARRRARRAGDAAHRGGAGRRSRTAPRCARALVIAADGRDSAVREGLGIARAALGLRPEGAGLHRDPRRCRTTASRPRSTARAGRSRWCRCPTATAGTPRRWSGWRPGPRAAELAAMPEDAFEAALNAARPAACSARSGSRAARRLWPIVAQVADAARRAAHRAGGRGGARGAADRRAGAEHEPGRHRDAARSLRRGARRRRRHRRAGAAGAATTARGMARCWRGSPGSTR